MSRVDLGIGERSKGTTKKEVVSPPPRRGFYSKLCQALAMGYSGRSGTATHSYNTLCTRVSDARVRPIDLLVAQTGLRSLLLCISLLRSLSVVAAAAGHAGGGVSDLWGQPTWFLHVKSATNPPAVCVLCGLVCSRVIVLVFTPN